MRGILIWSTDNTAKDGKNISVKTSFYQTKGERNTFSVEIHIIHGSCFYN